MFSINDMNYFFSLDNSFVTEAATKYLDDKTIEAYRSFFSHAQFSDQATYDQFVNGLQRVSKEHVINNPDPNPIFAEELPQRNRKNPLFESTPWGLVSIKKVDVAKDFIQKLLVVKQKGVLGFEYHDFKHEKLEVLEGLVLVLYANHADSKWTVGKMSAQIAAKSDTLTFLPYDEHGMVALTDSVVMETSTNHLDDLIFIYNSSQSI